MGKALQKRSNNLQHNVSTLLKQGRDSLTALARTYFVTEVAGQAKALGGRPKAARHRHLKTGQSE